MSAAAQSIGRLGVPQFSAHDHAYRVDGVRLPSVTQILQGAGLASYDAVVPDLLERKRQIGTAVHAWTARFDAPGADEAALWDEAIGSLIEPYCLAWAEFREQSGFQPGLIEHMFAAEHHGMRYAGTADRAGRLNDSDYVVELKTSASPARWWGLQLMGYAVALQQPARVLRRRIAVQLKPDGSYAVHEYKDPRDQGAFAAALAIATWKGEQA